MKKFLTNLGSRKFLIALTSVIAGILTMLNCDENLIQFICSVIMIVVPVIVYVIVEGVIDQTSIKNAMNEFIDAIQQYINSEEQEIEKGNDDVKELQEGTIEIVNDTIVIDK